MQTTTPQHTIQELVTDIGLAGRRMLELHGAEGSAGNISVCFAWQADLAADFPQVETIPLPAPAPALSGWTVLISGSGCRLVDLDLDPYNNLGALVIEPGGLTGVLHTTPQRRFPRLTSEFNSHLAVHHDQVQRSPGDYLALVHAQPPHLTYLSHLPRYAEQGEFNRRLLRWEAETIYQFQRGLALIPFMPTGSPELMDLTVAAFRDHELVVWGKHGAIARSRRSARHAGDLIDYAEAAARFEYMNLVAGDAPAGLSVAEIRLFCERFGIQQNIF